MTQGWAEKSGRRLAADLPSWQGPGCPESAQATATEAEYRVWERLAQSCHRCGSWVLGCPGGQVSTRAGNGEFSQVYLSSGPRPASQRPRGEGWAAGGARRQASFIHSFTFTAVPGIFSGLLETPFHPGWPGPPLCPHISLPMSPSSRHVDLLAVSIRSLWTFAFAVPPPPSGTLLPQVPTWPATLDSQVTARCFRSPPLFGHSSEAVAFQVLFPYRLSFFFRSLAYWFICLSSVPSRHWEPKSSPGARVPAAFPAGPRVPRPPRSSAQCKAGSVRGPVTSGWLPGQWAAHVKASGFGSRLSEGAQMTRTPRTLHT